jgi:hypothetical protein
MDHYLTADDWVDRLTPRDLTEYAFHRCDDETFRAANLIIQGDAVRARELLGRPYPLRCLVAHLRRRKLRVLLLRLVMHAALRAGTTRTFVRFLIWSEYGGQV